MTKKEDFDQAAAHKYFSAKCFNQAWELIDKEQHPGLAGRGDVAMLVL